MNSLESKNQGSDTILGESLGGKIAAKHFSAKVSLSCDFDQSIIRAIRFDVSDNEEQIVLMIDVDGHEVLVDSEHCLYMLLLLARARMIDQVSGLSDEQLGWLSENQFTVMLGCKQKMFYDNMLRFANLWQQKVFDSQGYSTIIEIPPLIEVDEGRIRFAYDDIQINCSSWCI